MDKINEFSVIGLSIEGFKCFSGQRTFQFGKMNSITGHNAQGKTTIAEAIAYAITGVPFFGGEHSLDRLYGIGGKSMTVELTLDTGDGAEHRLIRSREKDTTVITYDGIPVKQSDLHTMFGEKDVFLSIFNPLYFVEILGDKGKNLLERYLPAVPHESILSGLSEGQRSLLEGQKLTAPEAFLDKLRSEVKELESSVVYAEGQRDLLETQLRENAAAPETGAGGPTIPDAAALDAELLEAATALEKRRAGVYVSPYVTKISETSAGIEQLRAQFIKENTVLDGLRPRIQCPVCKQSVTEQNIEAVKATFQASIAEITAKGRELAAQLKQLQEMEDKGREVFEAFKEEDIRNMEAKLSELKAKRAAAVTTGINAAECTVNRDKLIKDIESYREQIKQKKELESAVKLYISERVRLMFSDFCTLSRVSVSLYDIIKKTGEVKDVFKFTYEDRPYKCLSLSEKIRAGLEISELIKKLTGRGYPVFIDNCESVPVIDNVRPTGQVFLSQVVKGAPLSVDILSGAEQQAA